MIAQSPPARPGWIRTALLLLFSVLLTCLWGWIDYHTESQVVLSVFYLIPIVIAAWYIHEAAGVAISLLCGAFTAYDSEIQTGLLFRSPWIGAWAIASRLAFFLFAVWLLGRQRRTMDFIRRMAVTDGLTGAYNARAFFDLLRREMERNRRFQHPLSLIYLDVDDFKKINDTLGHQTGDAVLEAVAKALSESVRRVDVVARLGGDEFSVLLPETDAAAARTTVERLLDNLCKGVEKAGWKVTVSIGAVTYRRTDCTADDIVGKADSLMYQVKRGGKNGVLFAVVPEEDPNPSAQRRAA
jgi:diguanylate cyclase (GGDEF)-like protein